MTNDVGRAGDPNFHERQDAHSGTAAVTYNFSPRDMGQIVLSGSQVSGYQASPYRYVRLASLGAAMPETHPRERQRGGVTLRYHRHLFTDTVVQTHARLYGDDWGLRSLTGGAAYLI